MRVPPTAAGGNGAADGLVELLGREIAEEVGVELADRRLVADAEAAVDDLDGQFAVCRRVAVGDPQTSSRFWTSRCEPMT